MKEKQIIFIAVATTSLIGALFWWIRNKNGSKLRGSVKYSGPAATARAADLRILSPLEERVRIQAEKLIKKGRVNQAAQMLEQVGLHRLAISALEGAKLIDDAARVLIRLQKPGRAAVVYSRHGMWHQAAQCFLQADAPLDAARCHREAGNFSAAGEIFAREKKFADAAECLQKTGQLAESARNWIKAKDPKRAIDCWNSLAADSGLMSVFRPSSEEIEIMFSEVRSGASHPGLLAHLAKSQQVTPMIIELLTVNQQDAATALFEKSPPHIASTLLAEVNVQSPAGRPLAALFTKAKEHQFAGMILEQLTMFVEASEAYKFAGDLERARYCLDRISGNGASPQTKSLTKAAENPVIPRPLRQDALRASFVIESSDNTAQSSTPFSGNADQMAPSPAMQVTHPISLAKAHTPDGDLTIDEETLIHRSWLINGASEDEVNTFIGFFHAREFRAGETILVGSPESFLVLAINGILRQEQTRVSGVEWLSPEIGLSAGSAVKWIAETTVRVLEIRGLDVDRVFRQNSDLTRTVYINLTQNLLARSGTQLNLKAI